MQRSSKLFLLTGASLLLGACGFNPQTSVPSDVQQCNSIQRQILFKGEGQNTQNNPMQTQASQDALQHEFDQMGCSKILMRAKQGKSANAPVNQTQKRGQQS